MYSSVHSSVNPQQSHFTDSTSVASVVRFAAGIIMASLITDVDISATSPSRSLNLVEEWKRNVKNILEIDYNRSYNKLCFETLKFYSRN
ncbi:hypothetical protein Hanom_Chr12g01079321 [Helianthus anomalus]